MDIEKYISPFIESQFPLFYREEGQVFIDFMKAYYEWMEQSRNPVVEARNLFDYRDIDNTLNAFLSHFQSKYLNGIPFNVISFPMIAGGSAFVNLSPIENGYPSTRAASLMACLDFMVPKVII